MSQQSGRLKAAAALFGTTRRHVLGLLFSHPERRFYQREIAAMVPTRLSAVQRELEGLVEADLVRRTDSGRRVYYQANVDHPLFPELRGIVLKTVGLADVLREVLEPLADRIEVAFVFGSMVAGDPTSASDVDMMVIGRVGLRDLAKPLRKAEEALAREVNPVTYSPEEFARRVAEGAHFVSSVLESPRIFLIGGEDDLKGLIQPEKAPASYGDVPGNGRLAGGGRTGAW